MTQVKKNKTKASRPSNATQPAERPIIGFVGLPSAGKSSLVNSLVGQRILHTGVCRTTKEVHLVGPKNLFSVPKAAFHKDDPISDDGIEFSIIDLPGVCDSENKGTEANFDEMTNAWVTNCDVVIWVSDVHTAFLTTHEKKEFDRIRSRLQQLSVETGTVYQCCILLSKYNHDDDEKAPRPESPQQEQKVMTTGGEISDDEEDTTASQCLERVQRLFPDEDVPILKFNAFGRVLSHSNTSPALRKLVRKMACGARDVHTEFELGRFFDDIQNRQQDARLANLVLHHLPSVTNLAVGLHQARALQQAEANLRKQLSAAIQRTTNSYGHVNAEHEQAKQLLQRTLTGVKSFQQLRQESQAIITLVSAAAARLGYSGSCTQQAAATIESLPRDEPILKLTSLKQPVQRITGQPQLVSLCKVLLCTSEAALQDALLACKLSRGKLRYNEEDFNSLCFYLGGLGISLEDCLKDWKPASSLVAFRAHCLLGRRSRLALQMLYRCSTKLRLSFISSGKRVDVNLSRGPLGLPASLRPADLCKFDEDCATTKAASRRWQASLVEVVADLWDLSDDDKQDLDGFALATLRANGTVQSAFCRGAPLD